MKLISCCISNLIRRLGNVIGVYCSAAVDSSQITVAIQENRGELGRTRSVHPSSPQTEFRTWQDSRDTTGTEQPDKCQVAARLHGPHSILPHHVGWSRHHERHCSIMRPILSDILKLRNSKALALLVVLWLHHSLRDNSCLDCHCNDWWSSGANRSHWVKLPLRCVFIFLLGGGDPTTIATTNGKSICEFDIFTKYIKHEPLPTIWLSDIYKLHGVCNTSAHALVTPQTRWYEHN